MRAAIFVVQQLLTVVGSKWKQASIPLCATAALFAHKLDGKPDKVCVAFEVCGFEEAFAVGFALRGTKVREPDAMAETANHIEEVVISTDAERACAEGDAVGFAGPLFEQKGQIRCGADDAWKSEQRARWVVRVYA